MWRTTNITSKIKLKGQRHRSSVPPPEGKPSLSTPPPPGGSFVPPPPPAKPGRFFLKFLGLTTVASGGVVGYALYDPKFKKQIEDNVPYSKEAFDAIQQMITPAEVPRVKPVPREDAPPSLLPPKPVNPEEESKMRKYIQKEQAVVHVKESLDTPAIPVDTVPSPPVKSEKERKKEEAQRMLEKKKKDEAEQNAALEVILENASDNCSKLVSKAVEIQQEVVKSIQTHSEALKQAMDDQSEILKKELQWEEVSSAYEARQKATAAAQNYVSQAREELNKLKQTIEEGKTNVATKKNNALSSAQKTLNKLLNEINNSETQVTKVESQSKMMQKYKDLVEQGKKQFQKELESIMPDVKLGQARGKKLTQEELNSLIAHAHRRIEQLQKQLAEQIALEQDRIQKSLEQQMVVDESIADKRIIDEQQRLRNEFLLEKDKWEKEARVSFEQELRQHLARQAAAHSDHLKDVLKVQEKELEQAFDRELNTKLIEERQSFHTEVANWIARLKGIEKAVEERAEAEKTSRKAQQLWLACVALNKALLHGMEEVKVWELKMKPLANEIAAVSDASGSHPYVKAILKTVPEVAYKRGVWTDDSLTDRFQKVHRVCRRVAMIDETGGGLGKRFLSYVQSFFIFESVYARGSHEEVEIDNLSTYQILANARYWMDKGDLEMTVRFMNQLQGEPRRVAEDWLKESKLHLEVRQATQALMGFASASGLGTIF